MNKTRTFFHNAFFQEWQALIRMKNYVLCFNREGILNLNMINKYIDLAKPKSGAPRLFILTACRVSENKRFRIVCVLMFPVAALIIKSFSLLSSIEKNHCLTNRFHSKFYAKNRYRMSHEAMSTISVFRVKFTFLSRMSLKENKHTLSERMEKEKAISESTVNSQRIVIKLKVEAIK